MDFVRAYLCCCISAPKPKGPQLPDERTLLIPQVIEPNVSYTDVSYLDQQKLQQRLGTIVRSKEGKMVNTASHIPFNLHNQPLIPDDRTISRSNSGSLDNLAGRFNHHPHPHYAPSHQSGSDLHHYHNHQYHHQHYGPSPLAPHSHSQSRSVSRSRSMDDDALSRRRYLGDDDYDGGETNEEGEAGYTSSSRERTRRGVYDQQPRPTPILNVRLVGYTGKAQQANGPLHLLAGGGRAKAGNAPGERGRARERGSVPSGLPDKGKAAGAGPGKGKGKTSKSGSFGSDETGERGNAVNEDGGAESPVTPQGSHHKKSRFVLEDDVSAIAVSWGD